MKLSLKAFVFILLIGAISSSCKKDAPEEIKKGNIKVTVNTETRPPDWASSYYYTDDKAEVKLLTPDYAEVAVLFSDPKGSVDFGTHDYGNYRVETSIKLYGDNGRHVAILRDASDFELNSDTKIITLNPK